ncbi:hypothetical protein QA649_11245 [Bradyrhizobium sp. CB1717]|uniref:hypothetical protein n=1 Tax=Bradyrhizobium sp. CB1717 TaxID=3039154 RepID=UPI0024B17D31|nr:hypothetical protein [Bradyrhizobium sp. CB1717]WFU26752.1 hypothetical protein QA649_11245 [Bradyrhizobium sp. CB1717]
MYSAGTIEKVLQSLTSALQSIFFVGLITYVLLYPLLSKAEAVQWLTFSGTPDRVLVTYTAEPVRTVLAFFLFIYFLPDFLVRWLRTRPLYQAVLKGFKYHLAPAASALGLLYLAIAFGSHYHFNMRDSLGSFCRENEKLGLSHDGFQSVGDKRQAEFVFDTSPDDSGDLCLSTGVYLKTGKRYHISVERLPEENDSNLGKWTFFGETSYMGGQPVSHLPPIKSAILATLFPLRRTFDRPWGTIIFRIGGKGNEEDFLGRDPPPQGDPLLAGDTYPPVPQKSELLEEGLTPKRDGELFVYLNKPVIGLWSSESVVSKWVGNTGKAKITIEK